MSNPVRIAYLGTFLAFASMQPAPACDADARDLHDASSVLSQSSARPDGSRIGTVVPIFVENGQVIVDVTINGRGPFPMMLDTGGVETVTPEAAAALGLEVEGDGTALGSGEGAVAVAFTRAKEMRLGDAKLLDQTLLCRPCRDF